MKHTLPAYSILPPAPPPSSSICALACWQPHTAGTHCKYFIGVARTNLITIKKRTMKKIRYGLEKNFNMLARRLHCILDTHPQNPLPCPLPTLYSTALYSMHIVLSTRGDSTWHFYRRAQSKSRRGKRREFIENICMNEAEQRRKAAIREGCRCAWRGGRCVWGGEGLPF